MMDFHCIECGDPISGGVSQSRCIGCLMGGEEEEFYCELCGDPTDDAGELCISCQEELDEYDDDGDVETTFGLNPDAFMETGDDC